MGKIGFIGYGSMGSMLIQRFIDTGAIQAENVIVATRTISKLNALKEKYPSIDVAGGNIAVSKECKTIFVCVRPLDMNTILDEISGFITPDTHLISIAGAVEIRDIEAFVKCKVTKLIPTITSEISAGVSLVCHNSLVSLEDKNFIEKLLISIGSVKTINEEDMGFATVLTSCGPGFFAEIINQFIKSAIHNSSNISESDIEDMVTKTFIGTTRLSIEKEMTFDEIVKRVATKGGITQEGTAVLEAELPRVFDEVFNKTSEKRAKMNGRINK